MPFTTEMAVPKRVGGRSETSFRYAPDQRESSFLPVPRGTRAEGRSAKCNDGDHWRRENMTGGMALPTLNGIEAAEELVLGWLPETPLVRSELLSEAMDADVWLKNETVSPIASFKWRGALTAISRATGNSNVGGAATSSTGNHGQGVAWAARALGIPAHIFLPENPNPVKRRMIEAFGATVHLAGGDIDEAKAEAQVFADRDGLLFVDDGESLDMMEGAGTVGLEIARRLPEVHTVFVPMGGGTLTVGCAAGIKGLQPGVRVIAVQAKGAPAMVESFHARRPVERPIDTVADGLVSRVPARMALEGLWALADDATTVSDEALLASVCSLVESAHVLVEPSGAAALAAAWERRAELRGRRIVLILSGANITPQLLRRALDGPPLFAER
jgi:threonine dehydratase